MFRVPVIAARRDKVPCGEVLLRQQPVIRKCHCFIGPHNAVQCVQPFDAGQDAGGAAQTFEQILNILGPLVKLHPRRLIAVRLQADGNALFPNQPVLALQGFFRNDAVHLGGILIALIAVQREKRITPESVLVYMAGHKADLQVDGWVKVI